MSNMALVDVESGVAGHSVLNELYIYHPYFGSCVLNTLF